MGGGFSSAGFAGTRRVMAFIDGGYLRKGLTEMFGDDKISYRELAERLREFAQYASLFPELSQVHESCL